MPDLGGCGITTDECARISQKQFDEDLEVYGRRPVPLDAEAIQYGLASDPAKLKLSFVSGNHVGEEQNDAGPQPFHTRSPGELGGLTSRVQVGYVSAVPFCGVLN